MFCGSRSVQSNLEIPSAWSDGDCIATQIITDPYLARESARQISHFLSVLFLCLFERGLRCKRKCFSDNAQRQGRRKRLAASHAGEIKVSRAGN